MKHFCYILILVCYVLLNLRQKKQTKANYRYEETSGSSMHHYFSRISSRLLLYTLLQMAIVSDLHRSRQPTRLNFLVSMYSSRNNQRTEKSRARKPRKAWIRPGRTSQLWDNFVSGLMLEEEWKENFRMSKSTFLKLCDAVRPFLVKQCTNMRMPVSVKS